MSNAWKTYRTARIAGFLLALGTFLTPDLAVAQAKMELAFPGTTARALASSEGASWDLIRRYGLVLSREGDWTRIRDGDALVVHALVVENGRVTGQWNSG